MNPTTLIKEEEDLLVQSSPKGSSKLKNLEGGKGFRLVSLTLGHLDVFPLTLKENETLYSLNEMVKVNWSKAEVKGQLGQVSTPHWSP